MALGAVCVLQP